jgi:uncharacterized membrane protein (DUF106 family)
MGPMFMTMMVFIIVLFVYGLAGTYIGMGLNYVLYPIMGFNGKMPLITVFVAAIIFPLLSRLVIFFTTDWVGRARDQHTIKHFQKELKDAAQTNNRYKMKKLQEMQPKIMEMQGGGMSLKSMVIPLIIILPIFAWLHYFFATMSAMPVGALPWVYVDLISSKTLFFPNWLLIYMVITFPFYMVLEKGLKLLFWSRESSTSGPHASDDSW